MSLDDSYLNRLLHQRRREVFWSGTATAEGSVERRVAMVSPRRAKHGKKKFTFFMLSGWALVVSTVVLCTAQTVTDFCFPCHP